MKNNACRILMSLGLSASTLTVFADNAVGIESVSGTADGISIYMPAVRVLCFSLAAVIAIVGCYYAYYQVQQGQETKKTLLVTFGSALCFCVMAMALPSFFGYDDTGSFSPMIAENSSGVAGYESTGSSLSSDGQGVPSGTIDTSIPDLDNPAWTEIPSNSPFIYEVSQAQSLAMDWIALHPYSDADLYMDWAANIVKKYGFDAAFTYQQGEYEFACYEPENSSHGLIEWEGLKKALDILETAYKYPDMLM